MATATIQANLTATLGSAALPSGSVQASPDLVGTDLGSSTQQVGTSYEQLDIPADVSFPAHLMVVNLSATSTLTLSMDNTTAKNFSVLPPGAPCVLPACPTKPYAKFDVAAQLLWRAVEV
jgi:hypothetical protein